MQGETLFASVRILGYVVLLAMLGSCAYTAFIALTHWSGIGV